MGFVELLGAASGAGLIDIDTGGTGLAAGSHLVLVDRVAALSSTYARSPMMSPLRFRRSPFVSVYVPVLDDRAATLPFSIHLH